MPITKKLMKLGNSYGIVIEKPILELLGINADTPLEISTPNGKILVITPVQEHANDDRGPELSLEEVLQRINEKYGVALRKLAE